MQNQVHKGRYRQSNLRIMICYTKVQKLLQYTAAVDFIDQVITKIKYNLKQILETSLKFHIKMIILSVSSGRESLTFRCL